MMFMLRLSTYCHWAVVKAVCLDNLIHKNYQGRGQNFQTSMAVYYGARPVYEEARK